jgi:hypothetical protein
LASVLEDTPDGSGLEITGLIENIIGRQEGLGLFENNGPIKNNGNRVAKGAAESSAVATNMTNGNRNARRQFALQTPQGSLVAIRKGHLIQKIHGGVARNCHFGENDQLGSVWALEGTVDRIKYAPGIAAKIPDY